MESHVIKDLKQIIDKEKEIIDKEKEIITKETQVIKGLEGILKSQLISQAKITTIPKAQTIKLTVQANDLYVLDYSPNQTDIDKFCLLEDVNHSSANYRIDTPLRHFSSEVYIKHDVMWTSETKYPDGIDKGYSVSIEKIKHEPYEKPINSPNFFKDPEILGIGSDESKMVTTVVKDDKNLEHDCYVYSIHFRIYKQNAKHKDYEIDPKLCCNT